MLCKAQTNLENLEKTVLFVTLEENLENSRNFEKIFQIPGNSVEIDFLINTLLFGNSIF